MPQIVVGDTVRTNLGASAGERFLAFGYRKNVTGTFTMLGSEPSRLRCDAL
jgi:hypothetical protein